MINKKTWASIFLILFLVISFIFRGELDISSTSKGKNEFENAEDWKSFQAKFDNEDYVEANKIFENLPLGYQNAALKEIVIGKDGFLNQNIFHLDLNPELKNKLERANAVFQAQNPNYSQYAELLKDQKNEIAHFFALSKIRTLVAESFNNQKMPLEISLALPGVSVQEVLYTSRFVILEDIQKNLTQIYENFKMQDDIEDINCYILADAMQSVMTEKNLKEQAKNENDEESVASQNEIETIKKELVPYLSIAKKNGLVSEKKCQIDDGFLSVNEILSQLEKSGLYSRALIDEARTTMGIGQARRTRFVDDHFIDMNQFLNLENVCDISGAIKIIDESLKNAKIKTKDASFVNSNVNPKTGCSVMSNARIVSEETVNSKLVVQVDFRLHFQNENKIDALIEFKDYDPVIKNIDLDQLKKELSVKKQKQN